MSKLLLGCYEDNTGIGPSSNISSGELLRNELEKRRKFGEEEDYLLVEIKTLDANLLQLASLVGVLQSNRIKGTLEYGKL